MTALGGIVAVQMLYFGLRMNSTYRPKVAERSRRESANKPNLENEKESSMGERSSSRRAFLGGIAGVGASATISKTASAQSTFQVNDPNVVREIEALFASYDDALRNNDVVALNGFFFDSASTVRFGVRENLYGI